MKKLILISAIMINLFGAFNNNNIDIYEPNTKNFIDGFNAGIKALEFQAKNDGFQQQLININNPYLLIYDISNTPLHEALFLQVISAREGFDTHFTKDFVSLGEFEREIDAKDAQNLIISKYKLESKHLKILNNVKNLVTYPFLFHNFYKNILNEAQKLGYIQKTDIVYADVIKIEKPKKTKKKKQEISKKIIFKNAKSMGYMLFGEETNSKNFIESNLYSKENFEFDKTITTNEGEIFVKVKNQNLYFSNSDVNIK